MKLGQTLLVMGGVTLACASLAGAPVVAGGAIAAVGVGLLGRYSVRASTPLSPESEYPTKKDCYLIEDDYHDTLTQYGCQDEHYASGFKEGFGTGFGTAAVFGLLAVGLSNYMIYQKCHKKTHTERPLSQLIPLPPVVMQEPQTSHAIGYDEPDRNSLEPRMQLVNINRSKNT